MSTEDKLYYICHSYTNLKFISILEDKIRNSDLLQRTVYAEYNGINCKFLSLEKYNKEYTNFKIANILCSGAFYLNLPNKNLCVHHSNVEFIIEESVLEEIYKNLTEDDFIDIIKLLDISPHECGIRFSAKEKINVVSLTANDITTNYKK